MAQDEAGAGSMEQWKEGIPQHNEQQEGGESAGSWSTSEKRTEPPRTHGTRDRRRRRAGINRSDQDKSPGVTYR